MAEKPTVAPKASGSEEDKHPKYTEMVEQAILFYQERTGSSRQAISKYIRDKYGLDKPNYVKAALKKGVEKERLVNTTGKGAAGSFKLTKGVKDEFKKKLQKENKVTEQPKEKSTKPPVQKKTAEVGDKKTAKSTAAAKAKKPKTLKKSASTSKLMEIKKNDTVKQKNDTVKAKDSVKKAKDSVKKAKDTVKKAKDTAKKTKESSTTQKAAAKTVAAKKPAAAPKKGAKTKET